MYAPGYGGANSSALIQNAMLTVPASVVTWIPSVKADYSISPGATKWRKLLFPLSYDIKVPFHARTIVAVFEP